MNKKIFHLSNAPIVEAIIDLRVTNNEWNPDSFQKDMSELLPDYPIIEPQRLIRTQVTAKTNEVPQSSAIDLGLRGFFFRHKDKLQVAQFQRDGFSFSRLKPYLDWNHLVAEARRLWDAYQKSISIQSVSRLGVRFIDQIKAPMEGELTTYLIDPPKPPCNYEWSFSEFLHRDVFDIANTPYNAILIRAMRTEQSEMVFSVDIDISTLSKLDDDAIWGEHLRQMHDLKNEIFFGSIQRSILEGMR